MNKGLRIMKRWTVRKNDLPLKIHITIQKKKTFQKIAKASFSLRASIWSKSAKSIIRMGWSVLRYWPMGISWKFNTRCNTNYILPEIKEPFEIRITVFKRITSPINRIVKLVKVSSWIKKYLVRYSQKVNHKSWINSQLDHRIILDV